MSNPASPPPFSIRYGKPNWHLHLMKQLDPLTLSRSTKPNMHLPLNNQVAQQMGSSATKILYTLRNVGKKFPSGVRALHNIDLEIVEGEIFGIIGRSGAGKSTLLRTLNLLESPTEGSIQFEGRELFELDSHGLREIRRRIGMIFQHFNLLSSRTVAGNIGLPLELAGVSKSQIKQRVNELLELVGLMSERDRYPSQISGGQKQRVGIARALASEPRVLLCDEATSALDPETTQSILSLLADINKRLGLTIVLITHQMQVIKQVAQRVAVLNNGELVEEGSVVDIFTNPKQEITQTLLHEVIGNEISPHVRDRARRLVSENGGRAWHFTFKGESVDRPALTEVAKRFSLSINLLHGYIDEIQGTPFGSLVAIASGDTQDLNEAELFVRSQNISIEEISL